MKIIFDSAAECGMLGCRNQTRPSHGGAKLKRKTKMKQKIIISKTGVAHGWGTEPYKWVGALTRDERAAVRTGAALVLVTGCPPSGGNHGTTTRMVVYRHGRYTHRMVSNQLEGCALQTYIRLNQLKTTMTGKLK